jgi:hypothetical protein
MSKINDSPVENATILTKIFLDPKRFSNCFTQATFDFTVRSANIFSVDNIKQRLTQATLAINYKKISKKAQSAFKQQSATQSQ